MQVFNLAKWNFKQKFLAISFFFKFRFKTSIVSLLGLSTEGNLRFKIDWASLIVGSKFTVFALFYFVFEGSFPSTSPCGGAYFWRGDLPVNISWNHEYRIKNCKVHVSRQANHSQFTDFNFVFSPFTKLEPLNPVSLNNPFQPLYKGRTIRERKNPRCAYTF